MWLIIMFFLAVILGHWKCWSQWEKYRKSWNGSNLHMCKCKEWITELVYRNLKMKSHWPLEDVLLIPDHTEIRKTFNAACVLKSWFMLLCSGDGLTKMGLQFCIIKIIIIMLHLRTSDVIDMITVEVNHSIAAQIRATADEDTLQLEIFQNYSWIWTIFWNFHKDFFGKNIYSINN